MKILLENSSYHHQNMGDAAMLQGAVRRLQTLWPESTIYVLTEAPDLAARYFPGVVPIGVDGHRNWFETKRMLFRPFYRFAPSTFARSLSKIDWKVRYAYPKATYRWLQIQRKFLNIDTDGSISAFLNILFSADLVIATGGGYVNDIFPYHLKLILDSLKLSILLGKPIFMMGQGIGPLHDPELKSLAQDVLTHASLISLREGQISKRYLNSLNVPMSRVMVTGDDAIELAYKSNPLKAGNGIGINLRLAKYSEVGDRMEEILSIIRKAIHAAATRHGTRLIPLPIAFHDLDSDVRTIQLLLEGYRNISNNWQDNREPDFIIEQTGNCRLVITGSYHAGVFALSQGIPVVALVKSKYYEYKFKGLSDQFGTGCHIVYLDDKELQEKLALEIDSAWNSANKVRPQLLLAAEKQIEMGKRAYQRLFDLVESRRHVMN